MIFYGLLYRRSEMFGDTASALIAEYGEEYMI